MSISEDSAAACHARVLARGLSVRRIAPLVKLAVDDLPLCAGKPG